MADLILSSNNAKFMDNAPLFLCHRTKGQSYWWKFLLFFTNQPFDIQIVCLPGICIEYVFVIESNSWCSRQLTNNKTLNLLLRSSKYSILTPAFQSQENSFENCNKIFGLEIEQIILIVTSTLYTVHQAKAWINCCTICLLVCTSFLLYEWYFVKGCTSLL